jgi:hypothetical protein
LAFRDGAEALVDHVITQHAQSITGIVGLEAERHPTRRRKTVQVTFRKNGVSYVRSPESSDAASEELTKGPAEEMRRQMAAEYSEAGTK